MLEIKQVWKDECPLVAKSTAAFEIIDGGRRIVLFGYASNSLVGQTCGVWAKVEPVESKIAVGRLTIQLRDYLLALFPEVVTLVACDDVRSQRWMKWLGFVDVGAEESARRMLLRRA